MAQTVNMAKSSTPIEGSPWAVTPSHRSSTTSIPRPISGSSRRATPTKSLLLSSMTDDKRRPRGHRKSWHPNEGAPPSSFPMGSSHPSIASGEATLSRRQHSANASTSKQPPRNHAISARSNPDLVDSAMIPPPYLIKTRGNLPRSTTMESLLTRDTAPRRSLLQPLGPPLPRSQTLGSMSCFNGKIATPSPRKPDPAQLKALRRRTGPEAFLDPVTQLNKSQVVGKVVEEVTQVQREAATQRKRLRHNITGQPRGEPAYPPVQNSHQSPSEADESVVRSPHPRPDMPGTEQAIQQRHGRRKLSIHFPLSTKPQLVIDSLPFTPLESKDDFADLPGGSSKTMTEAESAPYWAGRFVAICDKLRAAECERNEDCPLESNNDKDSRLDAQDKTRMCTALKILRHCCQTPDALQSFENFEVEFRDKTSLSRNLLHINNRMTPEKQGDAAFQGGKPNKLRKFRTILQSPNLISPMSSQGSSLELGCEAKFYGQGTLAKSKTTGNLASLLPLIHRKATTLTAGLAHNAEDAQAESHKNSVSFLGYSPGLSGKALKYREDGLGKPAAEGLDKSDTWRDSKYPGSDKSNNVLGISRTVGATIKHRRVSSFILVSTQSLESPETRIDHEQHMALSPKDEVKFNGSGMDAQITKGPGLRRKSERQFSGETVKNFFGAGIREMKKISRRVSGGMG